ncbi:DUF5050 domain-containing protein [Paenibacillus cremeus]|uniref:DUF5050 domain-containing protein n=1 Tax=Paenibacillus cremeus TaxID=2163881 RepID=A0A559K8M6_9BACL|nr:DUF5050 domain-containing protein [Paenibacillus cremeus]TVY08479.1 DUF5050 domain-containing protein [Paenibacillus cremeus]
MLKPTKSALCALLIGLSITAAVPDPVVQAAPSSVSVKVGFPEFPVAVNGSMMDVKHSAYPLLLYKDITYFPMTWTNTAALALTVAWDAKNGLSLQKKAACEPLQQDLTPKINTNAVSQYATLVPFPVQVNGRTVYNSKEPYPVLLYKDITYFPMTWAFTHDDFGWNTSWDTAHGFGIQSCDGGADAQAKQTDTLNLANGGQVAVSGDWIYMNPTSSYDGPNKLVKVNQASGEEIKLSDDNARSINVVGDWVYYTAADPSKSRLLGLYRIKTDGTQRAQVSSEPTSQIWVQGDSIYYIHQSFLSVEGMTGGGYYKMDGLHTMKLDGTGDQSLTSSDYMQQFVVSGNQVYYISQKTSGESQLYAMNLDGSGQTLLQTGATRVFVIDGWVYFTHIFGKQLSKMRPDSQAVIPVYTSDKPIATLSYHDGWIYTVAGMFGIMGSATIGKLRVDGSQWTELMGARATSLYFAGNTLYYPQAWMGDNPLKHQTIE